MLSHRDHHVQSLQPRAPPQHRFTHLAHAIEAAQATPGDHEHIAAAIGLMLSEPGFHARLGLRHGRQAIAQVERARRAEAELIERPLDRDRPPTSCRRLPPEGIAKHHAIESLRRVDTQRGGRASAPCPPRAPFACESRRGQNRGRRRGSARGRRDHSASHAWRRSRHSSTRTVSATRAGPRSAIVAVHESSGVRSHRGPYPRAPDRDLVDARDAGNLTE